MCLQGHHPGCAQAPACPWALELCGALWRASLTHQHSGFSRPSWSRCGARLLCFKAGPVPCWGPGNMRHPVPVACPLQACSPRAQGPSWNAVFLDRTCSMSRLRSRDLRLPPALLLPCGLALACGRRAASPVAPGIPELGQAASPLLGATWSAGKPLGPGVEGLTGTIW